MWQLIHLGQRPIHTPYSITSIRFHSVGVNTTAENKAHVLLFSNSKTEKTFFMPTPLQGHLRLRNSTQLLKKIVKGFK